jgi:DNA-binding GntR family transcriptional regulator
MSPRAVRQLPIHRQVADDIAARISAGEQGYRPGDKLPSMRETAEDWGVAFSAAQEAYRLLAASKQVETRGQTGTFVLAPRNIFGPYQEMRSAVASVAAETQLVTVTGADLVPMPEYIRPILGLSAAVSHVIRREWITSDSTGPYMLSVSWVPPRYANDASELMELEPLADPAGPAHLVAERAGQPVTWWTNSHEARPIKDDGREGPLLGLGAGDYVLAEVFVWGHAELVLEYREFIARTGRVIVTNLEL